MVTLITHLDKQPTAGLALEEAVEKMRGAPNVLIRLTIQREGVDKPLEFVVVREVIHIRPVMYEAIGDVAYIRIATFNEHAAVELEKAVSRLKKDVGHKLKVHPRFEKQSRRTT